MVGRAHYGAPWTAGGIAAAASGTETPARPEQVADLIGYIVSHYEDMLALYGVESGLRQARKHLGWYLDRHAPAVSPERRKAILTCGEPSAVISLLRDALSSDAASLEIAA